MLEELGQPDFVEEDANGFVWTAHRLDDGSGRMMLSMFPPGQIKIIDEVGRNQPCPCGSGRKYKKCCGRTN
jgi:uncharacterized protein YecA (UPF0149 family)